MGRVQEVVRVVVVSPGDVERERAVAQTVVDELNRGVARDRGCRLALWRWEIDARPGMHLDGPQGLIDEVMDIRDADIVVGVFWKRFGTPTGDADSGTEHELRRAWAAWQEQGRPEVMVYVCTREHSPATPEELAQWQRVLEFRQAMPEQQMWWQYPSVPKFERLLREHLTALLLSRASVRGRGHASDNGSESAPSFPLPPAVAAAARDVLVGRAADLDALAAIYARAVGGDRQLVLLCGEPGIGKTRLAAEHALRAHAEGAIVLHGRCDEQALLPLQPYVEALRHYVCACPVQALIDGLRSDSGELRRLVPEIADRVPNLPAPLMGDPDGARSRLFEAISALLCAAAQGTPVVLVLDDLHWADPATPLLLEHLMRYPRQARLMVLGTFRDTGAQVDRPLAATLAELERERLLQRRALGPLDEAAVSALVGTLGGEDASVEIHRSVFGRTEGNPFFIVELVRHLVESGAIGSVDAVHRDAGSLPVPESVRGVIAERMSDLGPKTHKLLTTASVFGRAFELAPLQLMSELDEDELVDCLDAAVRARVIEEVGAGRYMFSHALIRDTVYGELTATRRALRHRRAGAALEIAYRDALEPHLAELANHFAEGGSSADLERAIDYGARAGARAVSQLAYEQGAAHFRQAARLLEAAESSERERRRCDLAIAQGEAERQAGDREYRRTLLDAARLAQRLGDAERLARAALANSRGFPSSGEGIDRERVSVLQAALDAYDSADSPTRAELMALLALELLWDDGWRVREHLSDGAVAMARRLGDPRTRARVLTWCSMVQWGPEALAQRRADLREAGELAYGLNDPLLAGHAAWFGSHAAMEAGDLHDADRLIARLAAVADQLGQPVMRWYAAVSRAKRCFISGPAEEAERLVFTASELGRDAEQTDSMLWFIAQLCLARFLRGSLDAPDPHLPDLLEALSSSLATDSTVTPSRSFRLQVSAGTAVTLCEVGRVDDAKRHFELLMSSGLDDLPHDYTALMAPAFASVACARIGDREGARRLHAILEPHSHVLVNAGPAWLGATTHYLGLLAATLGDADEAEARFAAAERTYASLSARPWLSRLCSDWAGALLATGRGDNARRAAQMRERAAGYREPA